MQSFIKHSNIFEDLANLKYDENDDAFALQLISDIDDSIGTINTEIELDKRSGKSNSKKVGISILMDDKERSKYSQLANKIIDQHPELERVTPAPDRVEKDFAVKYKHMDRYVYCNLRPNGKRSAAGDDPNELMTALLCIFPKIPKVTNSDEMDALIEDCKAQLGKAKGYTPGMVASMGGDYSNLAQAISAANTVHAAGYGSADKVYLTGQSWDDDVKQFQITKHGMADFNSSDFIVKKGNKFLGVSLKKKKRLTETDPTLINKSFATLFKDKKFDKMMEELDKRAGMFYLRVLAKAKKMGALSSELELDMKKKRPNTKNWKNYIQRIDNSIINSELKGSNKSLFKQMSDIIIKNKDMIANQLVQLIFKADLKDLQKVNFDFALVTGVGDYGPSKGVVVEKGEFKDINTVTTKLDDLFSQGGTSIRPTPNKIQAYEPGAGAAMLHFDLLIGNIPACHITLRYKGNFRSAPSFMATMTNEFKALYK